ncbi:putative ABC transporter superfamily, ABCG family. PDR (TC 3.A.1.205) subfamily protein [Lyophyllum shimeji]|uniref:ABC transporter superfamily, ABCG family. PDR (TC 3.A.1.205) subfamily protein n=1 Tax=Lyophyllum shimeji TaxID=47721 RepID=A0A9P3PVD8_LYOSH|nr:putative ABC transporter superfamily, ABCG family. PDR (TC 3.A.1.205) subfamily protein [Lyophyllum shimeji]
MDSVPLSRATSAPTTVTGDTDATNTDGKANVFKRDANVSRVDIDSLDPAGVEELRRTLTQNAAEVLGEGGRESFANSDATLTGLTGGDGPFDFEKTLRAVVRKRDTANIKHRTLGIVFRNLQVVGLGATDTYQPTLGSLFSPKTILNNIQAARHPPVRNILDGFEGVVQPGQMLLVLGRPGSGCSTFLKTLANMRDEYYAVNGEVHYDSLSSSEIQKHYRGDVQYCPEDDIHFATLTVEQTLKFAAKTRAPHARAGETRASYTNILTDILTTLLGLRHARKTPVGDAAIRGVSGGEKKRVSIAESFATRACIGAWDNSTRGLDSSTALEYVRALRIATDTFNTSTIVSIYQAGESLYQHFDKVCLIYEGKMAYFGPASQAKQYFIDMGYQPANRQTTADFLVSVTDPKGRIERQGVKTPPRTADEFAEYFKNSPLGAANREAMDSYTAQFVGKPKRASAYIESAQAEHARHVRPASPYMISIPMQARAVMLRRVQILRGNMLATGLNLFSFVFQGLIVGSVYLKLPQATSAYFSRGGVLFFALLFAALTTMAEIPALYAQRPIVHRHKIAALYHPFVEALALTLVDVPITFATMVVFGVILYFMVGLQRSAAQFFVFFLFIFTMSITMKAWFRAIAAAFKSEASAQTVAGISILALSIYTGYSIPKPSMIGALRWITYINPLRYGFEAILTNEFRTLNGTCSTLIPQGPGYENVPLSNKVCTAVGSRPGEPFVDGGRFAELSYGFSYSHTWMNFGILIAFAVGFISFLLLFSEFNTSVANETSVVMYKQSSKSSTSSGPADEEAVLDEKLVPHSPSNDAAAEANKEMASQSPMTDIFSWQHVNYSVPIPGEDDRKLLSDVTGYVAPGKLTALMGESGAGKTTLLNVLAQRVSTGVVTGDMFVNGQALPKDFQAQTGYCQQMDTHMPTATVREALLFSAKLRQPAEVPLAEKEAYVEKCLKMCGLEAYGDAIVGSLGVEQRKRTTIGVELAAKPKLLLFLDEPTSGLDSQSAWSIMSFLRSLADNGQAILCTIHQPSAELFQVFDRMLLLRKGGQTVYFGDLGKNATTLIRYFERNGSRECHPDENPAEFMLDVIGAGATATSAQNWHEIWCNSDESKRLQIEVEDIHTKGRNRPPVEATLHSEFATSWFTQTALLCKRNVEAYWRDPTYLMAKLVLNIFGGLFIGFTFWNSQNTQQGTQNKLFAIFMATILSVPLSNQLQVPFIATRSIYEIRERPSRMYSWTALVTSQVLVELPWNILGSTLLYLCWYWTVGFDNSRAGFTYLVLGVIFPLYYTTIGQAVAAMAPNAEIAALLFSFLFSFVIMFNGVLQPFSQLGWWRWMYRLSPYTYLIEALLGQAIGRQSIKCSPVEFVTLNPPAGQSCGQYLDPFISVAGGYLTNPSASSACNYCSVSSSDQFLARSFNIFYHHRWRDVGFMSAFIVFNIFCIFLFTYLFRIRTGSLLPSFRKSSKKA